MILVMERSENMLSFLLSEVKNACVFGTVCLRGCGSSAYCIYSYFWVICNKEIILSKHDSSGLFLHIIESKLPKLINLHCIFLMNKDVYDGHIIKPHPLRKIFCFHFFSAIRCKTFLNHQTSKRKCSLLLAIFNNKCLRKLGNRYKISYEMATPYCQWKHYIIRRLRIVHKLMQQIRQASL